MKVLRATRKETKAEAKATKAEAKAEKAKAEAAAPGGPGTGAAGSEGSA